MARMNQQKVLEAFETQVRRHPGPDDTDGRIERTDTVVRCVPTVDGWAGVMWSDLDEANADEVIAEQVRRFAEVGRPWEWKHYSGDQPADLPQRLVAAGFTPGPPETLLIAEIADLLLDVPPPPGVDLVPVVDAAGVDALVAVSDEVFGGDHAALGRNLAADLAKTPPAAAAVIAMAGDTPICAGRIAFHEGTEFASIWGGGTIAPWRGRGAFRAVVAYRAALAVARGFRYLQVDASPDSRPILRRLGFVEMATTTPFDHPGV